VGDLEVHVENARWKEWRGHRFPKVLTIDEIASVRPLKDAKIIPPLQARGRFKSSFREPPVKGFGGHLVKGNEVVVLAGRMVKGVSRAVCPATFDRGNSVSRDLLIKIDVKGAWSRHVAAVGM